MSLIVQKFGGTSVADTDSLRIVAERIIDCKKNGNDVVVVPSAMGSSTDELIQLANDLSENPTPRELDMLLSAGERITMSLLSMHLNSLGYSSFSLTGSQAGIITTSRHGQAEIEEITGERVKEGLENGDIVIVAGLGNLPGVAMSGMGLGVFEEFADYILGTEFRIGSVFLLLVLILVYRRFKLSRKREYLK